jgi:uncharacterized protein (TIGR03067 family)
MLRQTLGLALLTALAVPSLADDKGAVDEKLVGVWSMNGLGKPIQTSVVPKGFGSLTLEKDGKAIWRERGKPDVVGTWKADASRTPKEFDVTATREEGKGPETLKAIYEVDGDKLRVSNFPDGWGKDRPNSFKESKATVMYLNRQK